MAKEPENTPTRLSQLEELSSNMLRSIDILHQDVEVIKDYTVQNNKFVHALQVRMDDLDEKFGKFLAHSNRREEKTAAELQSIRLRSEEREKKVDDEFQAIRLRTEEREKKVDTQLLRLNEKSNLMLDQMLKDQELRDKQIEELNRKLENLRKD
ncbi:MAG: hypothetical protein RIF33_20875 [Cyclobacteriaceae bacterium]